MWNRNDEYFVNRILDHKLLFLVYILEVEHLRKHPGEHLNWYKDAIR
jgi:hypothetical protein